MQHPFWKSRTFRTWLICYLVVLLIPIVFNALLYAHSSRALTARAYENGESSLRQLAGVLDQQMETVGSVSNTICVATDVKKLRYIDLPFNAQKYYEVHQRASYLSNFAAYSDLVSGLYLYCDNLECILDRYRIFTRTNQYSKIITENLGLTEAQFDELMLSRHQQDLYVTGGGQKLLLLQTVDTGVSSPHPPLTLIVSLNTQALITPLSMASDAWQGQARIVLPDEAVLSGGDGFFLSASQWAQMQTQEAVVNLLPSGAADMTYALAVPQSILLHDVRSTGLLFVYLLLCTLVLGCSIAYVLARHNYKPVSQLKRSANVDTHSRNDFTAIESRLMEIKHHNVEMQTELQRLSLVEDAQIFRALLSGKTTRLHPGQIEQLRENFDGDLFIAAAFEADGDEGMDEARLLSWLRERFPASTDACQCLLRASEQGAAAIFCFMSGASLYDAQLYVKELVKNVFAAQAEPPSVSVYIGNAHESLGGISQSWQEALKAKEYANFVSETGKQVVLYDQTMYSSSISWKEYDIVDAERRFASLMIEGNYAASELLLHEMLSYYTGHEGLSLYVMQCRMYGVMNMMLNILHEVEPDSGALFYKEGKPLEKLLSVRTMQELEDVVFQIMEQLHRCHNQTQDQLSSKLARVENYIASNYFNPNLSVQMVADTFDLSLPYLSREFKSRKGIGVLSFINRCRIEKAKEIMLSDASVTIADIARQVGYNSSQTLIRIFKRYEGVTPGQFRAGGE